MGYVSSVEVSQKGEVIESWRARGMDEDGKSS